MLFVALLFPAGFAGWAVGHYTSSSSTVVHTVTLGTTSAGATTSAPATTSAGATTKAGTTTPAGGGSVAAGKAVFAASGCAACHTFKPANSTGTIGPNLDTEPVTSAKADHNMNLTAFIKQSITDPNAYIAKGYPPNLMPKTFGTSLSPKQLNDLVAFILSGSSSS